MVLIEKEKLFNLWNPIEKGGLIRIIPEENNPNRERGSPMSDKLENLWLLRRLEENIKDFGPIHSILELGVADGGGAKIWEQVLIGQYEKCSKPPYPGYVRRGNPKDFLYIGVDNTPNILWDYKNSPVDMRVIAGDTHSEVTRDKVKQILDEKKLKNIDFLFIDAQHHSVDVIKDFVDYGGFVRENGLIGFHDTRLCRSFWDDFTGGGVDAVDDPANDIGFRNERAVFHKEEIKYSLGTGIFYKSKEQNVIKFRDI